MPEKKNKKMRCLLVASFPACAFAELANSRRAQEVDASGDTIDASDDTPGADSTGDRSRSGHIREQRGHVGEVRRHVTDKRRRETKMGDDPFLQPLGWPLQSGEDAEGVAPGRSSWAQTHAAGSRRDVAEGPFEIRIQGSSTVAYTVGRDSAINMSDLKLDVFSSLKGPYQHAVLKPRGGTQILADSESVSTFLSGGGIDVVLGEKDKTSLAAAAFAFSTHPTNSERFGTSTNSPADLSALSKGVLNTFQEMTQEERSGVCCGQVVSAPTHGDAGTGKIVHVRHCMKQQRE
ncbi:unnamed protein product [Amoebophrya sp. A25]|nr:unnamed protein product [Amoebophrya sp. A25]|eukprot:GSA25T00019907001.1